jgi:hypothetical protein
VLFHGTKQDAGGLTADRIGLFYQNFTLGLLESKNRVGWRWFKYSGNDYTLVDAKLANTNANKGIVYNFLAPYPRCSTR